MLALLQSSDDDRSMDTNIFSTFRPKRSVIDILDSPDNTSLDQRCFSTFRRLRQKKNQSIFDDDDYDDRQEGSSLHLTGPEKEILEILTDGIWKEDASTVETTLERLDDLLRIGDPRFKKNHQAYKNGAPMALCQTMKRFPDEETIQTFCTIAFVSMTYCLSSGDVAVDLRSDLVRQGAVKLCLRAMEQYPESTLLLSAACNFLGNMMAWNKSFTKQVVDVGGMKAVISALEKHPADDQVQQKGCRALECLLDTASPGYDEKFVAAGAINLMVDAMINHSDNNDILLSACQVFEILAKDNEAHRKMIVDDQGLVAVSSVISIPDLANNVKQAAVDAMCALCPVRIVRS